MGPARRWSRSLPARFFDRPHWPRAWNRLDKELLQADQHLFNRFKKICIKKSIKTAAEVIDTLHENTLYEIAPEFSRGPPFWPPFPQHQAQWKVHSADSGGWRLNFETTWSSIQYRSKLWDHLPRFCLCWIAVLICSFTSAKSRLTALKTSVSPRFFPVDLRRGAGRGWVWIGYCSLCKQQLGELSSLGAIKFTSNTVFERSLHWQLYRSEGK